MRFFTFTYGTGVLYGAVLAVDYILPTTGPSTGGQDFVIIGNNFDFTTYDDDFTAGTLAVSKWTDLSSGTGSVSTGTNHLVLGTGATSSSVSGIEMNAGLTNAQFESRVQIPRYTSFPTGTINLYTMQMYIDASNYCDLAVNMSSEGAISLEVSVYKGASLSDYYSESWTSGLSTFKILRWSDNVYFYANGNLLYRSKQFLSTVAKFRFFCSNLSTTYDIQDVILSYVKNKTFVVFENEPVHDTTTVGNRRLRGVTPPSVDARDQAGAYKGTVDVSVVTEFTSTVLAGYEYYYLDNLTLVDNAQYGVRLSKIGDSSVRTPRSDNIGLGGGR